MMDQHGQLPEIERITVALDFLEDHLSQPIGMSDVAEAAGYSLFHFGRLFNRVIGLTPYDYLIRRRIAEAAGALFDTDRKIIEVAFDFQFNSSETFSRAFKRVLGVLPSNWRKDPFHPPQGMMPRLTTAHLAHWSTLRSPPPHEEVMDEMVLTGLMTLSGEDPSSVAELWQALEFLIGPLGRGDHPYYAVRWFSSSWDDRSVPYLASVPFPFRVADGSPLVEKKLPACRYARFNHGTSANDHSLTLDYIFHSWLVRSGDCLAYPLVVERYAHSTPADHLEILIPLRSAIS